MCRLCFQYRSGRISWIPPVIFLWYAKQLTSLSVALHWLVSFSLQIIYLFKRPLNLWTLGAFIPGHWIRYRKAAKKNRAKPQTTQNYQNNYCFRKFSFCLHDQKPHSILNRKRSLDVGWNRTPTTKITENHKTRKKQNLSNKRSQKWPRPSSTISTALHYPVRSSGGRQVIDFIQLNIRSESHKWKKIEKSN